MPFDIGQLLSTIFSQALGGGGAAQGVRPSNGMAPQFGGGLFGGAFQNIHSGNAFSSANPYISQVASVANQAGTRSGLPSLDTNTQNALNTIQSNQMNQLQRQFHDQQASMINGLYGFGAEHSGQANDIMARLAERQGYVADQAASDAANRFLGQQNTSADRSLQGLGMQQQGLGQAAGLTNEQNQMQFQQQQQQLQTLVSLLPTLLQAHQSIGGGGGPAPQPQEDFAHSATYGNPQAPASPQSGGYTNSGQPDTRTGWENVSPELTAMTKAFGNDPSVWNMMANSGPYAGNQGLMLISKLLANPQFLQQLRGMQNGGPTMSANLANVNGMPQYGGAR